MGPISKHRLTLVHPKLAALVTQLDAEMDGWLGVTQGLRTWDEQKALFYQGRLTTAEVNAFRTKCKWAPITDAQNIKVTDAQPGYSWHNFGLAVDVVPEEVNTGVPDWNLNHPVWLDLYKKILALGLVSGISWRDEPHVQLTGRFPVTPTDEVREIYGTGGIPGVWLASGVS